ncbi:hypothetical protein [Rickettsia endosymbiont of Halotydeus destructor]|uniref:hypothetical protein n=1 Tax=Rickettsia endosymbiont of Halotydeus destructor TaxID=2996754 RepID=UPI003BB04EC8
MPNSKNSQSKFLKNLILAIVSTTVLNGVTLEARGGAGVLPPPPTAPTPTFL